MDFTHIFMITLIALRQSYHSPGASETTLNDKDEFNTEI